MKGRNEVRRRTMCGFSACFLTLVACNGGDGSPAVRSTTSVDAGVTTTTLAPPTTVPATTTTVLVAPPVTEPPPPTTTTTLLVGGPDDPYGPVLCPGLPHPAHHHPCPAKATTATTALPRTAAVAAPKPVASAAPASSGGGSGRCGGDLPPCSVMNRESGGDPTAVGYGKCSGRDCQGKWQIDPNTAASVGYPKDLASQPESVQDDAARAILARDGCGAWSTC